MSKQAVTPFIEEARFAAGLISYVKDNPVTFTTQEAEIPEHWTFHNESQNFSGATCLVHHGLFDTFFTKRAIFPQRWFDFERQFLNPAADLLERMYEECQTLRTHSWTGQDSVRNDFFMNHDFWTEKAQQENYRHILSTLRERGMVRENASRSYNDDPTALALLVDGEWIDIPSSYRMLRAAVNEQRGGGNIRFSFDMPRVQGRYGQRIPVAFLVADTVPRSGDSPENRLYQLVEDNTSPQPKYQEILYVFAERNGATYTPRLIGHMRAYLLEFAYGSPAGAILSDYTYMVPQEDLSENELKSLDCSRSNWEIHQQHLLEPHQALKAYLER